MQAYGPTVQEVNPTTTNSAQVSEVAQVIRFPQPWFFDLGLQPRALALACAIAQWTLKKGWCYYSAADLATRLGWSARTVERALGDLRKAEILNRNRRGIRLLPPAEMPASTAATVGKKKRTTDNGGGATTRPIEIFTDTKKKRVASSNPVALPNAEPDPKPQPLSLSLNSPEVKKTEIGLVDFVTERNGTLPRSSFKRKCEIRDRLQEGHTLQELEDAIIGIRDHRWAKENGYWGDPIKAALKDSRFERCRDAGRECREEDERENNRGKNNPIFALREAEAEIHRRWREET